MTIWRAGMKAVCVDDRPLCDGRLSGLESGRVYTVVSVGYLRRGIHPTGRTVHNATLIELGEVTHPDDNGSLFVKGYGACRFRPAIEGKSENKHFEALRDLLKNPNKVLEEA